MVGSFTSGRKYSENPAKRQNTQVGESRSSLDPRGSDTTCVSENSRKLQRAQNTQSNQHSLFLCCKGTFWGVIASLEKTDELCFIKHVLLWSKTKCTIRIMCVENDYMTL